MRKEKGGEEWMMASGSGVSREPGGELGKPTGAGSEGMKFVVPIKM